ncbi:hypothetical protein WHR41_09652 [Cladosporium halotolerans]|uniref:HAT C-terminal dimerisation domain-containing protein n=1 Tax=Cladosporium halotolerans TaxID=1052096 RepID=A0AB34KCR8_9PEZI
MAASSLSDDEASGTSSRKRKLGRNLNPLLWEHSRKPVQGIEPTRNAAGRRIWYCSRVGCEDYSVVSAAGIRWHLERHHGLVLGEVEPGAIKKAKQQDLTTMFGEQKLVKDQQAESELRDLLRSIADKDRIQQAVLRLIVRRDLPLRLPCWPEMNTLLHAANYMATSSLWDSPTTTANHVKRTFEARRIELAEHLRRSRSKIHLTTDTWHSPNRKQLQAITAHWLRDDGSACKALLSLTEMPDGHAGLLVAAEVIRVLDLYGIRKMLGYTTTDNATCNDTMCRALSDSLGSDWDATEGRLRCAGHIINLPMQAFLFAKDKEAVEEALRQADLRGSEVDEEIAVLSRRGTEGGWITVSPHQKVHAFGVYLRKSDRLFQDFKRLAGRSLHQPNDTRWHSWFDEFEGAYRLRDSYSQLIHNNPNDLADFELSTREWDLVKITIDILVPFKIACKKLEGDEVTLDAVQETMDFLATHLGECKDKYRSNPELLQSLMTCWYAFDKYYKLIDQSAAYVTAILLHPNKRKNYLTAAWKQRWVQEGIQRAKALWYRRLDHHNAEVMAVNDELRPEALDLDPFARWQLSIQRKQQSKGAGLLDEFERFIAAAPDTLDFTAKSVVQWWIQPSQQEAYPLLSQHALDVLSAPSMSAESERVFSGARRTISWSRTQLSSPIIEALECLKHWQVTGVVEDDFVIRIPETEESQLAEKDSST